MSMKSINFHYQQMMVKTCSDLHVCILILNIQYANSFYFEYWVLFHWKLPASCPLYFSLSNIYISNIYILIYLFHWKLPASCPLYFSLSNIYISNIYILIYLYFSISNIKVYIYIYTTPHIHIGKKLVCLDGLIHPQYKVKIRCGLVTWFCYIGQGHLIRVPGTIIRVTCTETCTP